MQQSNSPNDRQVGGDHYALGGDYQHWDMIELNGIGYLEGCATKYLARWKRKGGVEDLRKAEHYVEKLNALRRLGREPRGRVPEDQLQRFFKLHPDIDMPEQRAISLLCGRWDQLDVGEALGVIIMLIKQNTADNGPK